MPGFWRKCRIAFRCIRFTVWGVVLLFIAAFGWFNLVGLPGFLKTRLVAALHENGVQLEFTRMRLRVIHGLVCENVRVGPTDNSNGPELTAREVQLHIDFPALLHRRLRVGGLVLRQGQLAFPLAANNTMALTNLQGELRILPDDTWSLDQFRASLVGVNFNFAGAIAHAPEFRNWKMFAGARAPDHGSVQSSMQGFSETLKQIHFSGKTQLNARFDGDARDVHSFTFTVSARAPGIETPWFSVSNLDFAAHLSAPTNAPLYHGPASGFWTNLQPFRLDWLARGTNFKSPKVSANSVDCSGVWGDPRNIHTFAVAFTARAQGVETPWFGMYDLDFAARALALTNAPRESNPAWGFWTNLQPFQADWLAHGTDLKSDKLEVQALACNGNWSAPQLSVTDLSAHFENGTVGADAHLNLTSRELGFTAASSIDPHTVAPLLTEQIRRRLADISWPTPPQLHFGGSIILPVWTNRPPDWPGDLSSTMKLYADVAFTNAQITNIPLPVTVRTHFNYASLVWQVANLDLLQGDTRLKLRGEESDATKNFHCVVDGQLDAKSVAPFLTQEDARRGFRLLQFRQPVSFALDAAGNWRNLNSLTATGRVAVTDFAIRDQWIDSVAAAVSYTNLFAQFYHPQLARSQEKEKFEAEKVTLDIKGQKLFLYNGQGNVLPAAVGKAIGPKSFEAMEPYQFLTIPEVTANGCIPLKQAHGDLIPDDADIWFHVLGTAPFRWKKFETPAIGGWVHWRANYLILTNVTAECYGGTGHGWGVFDLLTPGDGTDFSFFMEGTNVDLNAMGRALWSPTNQLRGALAGNLMITRANSSDWRTWNGFGEANLKNGLIWNTPIFGLMSPLLNTLTPGLDIGNSRATDAGGRYTMTNGVIFTDSLAIRSSGMRLDYVGTVDLDENVTARVKAQLFRNTPIIGSLVSMVLMPVSAPFECEVTGTLDEPKIAPVYIPFSRVLTAPLHPIRTVQKIFAPGQTNSAARQ